MMVADVQPRLSMSEIDAMDDTEPYKVRDNSF